MDVMLITLLPYTYLVVELQHLSRPSLMSKSVLAALFHAQRLAIDEIKLNLKKKPNPCLVSM